MTAFGFLRFSSVFFGFLWFSLVFFGFLRFSSVFFGIFGNLRVSSGFFGIFGNNHPESPRLHHRGCIRCCQRHPRCCQQHHRRTSATPTAILASATAIATVIVVITLSESLWRTLPFQRASILICIIIAVNIFKQFSICISSSVK
jgi:hypothetical protein